MDADATRMHTVQACMLGRDEARLGMSDLDEGGQLGRYTLVRRIGKGGMGEVWLAKSTGAHGFEKNVALKRILPQFSSNPHVVNMLVDEARISVLLNHPNVVQVLELGEDGGDYFIAMEYVEGQALSRLLRRLKKMSGKLDILEACYICIQVLEGLHAAHVQKDHRGKPAGIIHRDVSPQNVLVSMDGMVKVIDFGIARARERLEVTQGPNVKGKLRYMAPEQLAPKMIKGKAIDHRVDVFAAGIVMYEMLANKQRFPGDNEPEIMDAIMKEDTPDLCKAGLIDRELMDILDTALEKDREKRFKDCAAFAAHLRSYLYKRDPGFTAERIARRMRQAFLDEAVDAPDERPGPGADDDTKRKQKRDTQERAARAALSGDRSAEQSLHGEEEDDDDRDKDATRTAFRPPVRGGPRAAAGTDSPFEEDDDDGGTMARRGRRPRSRFPAVAAGLLLGAGLLAAGVLVIKPRIDANKRGTPVVTTGTPVAGVNGAPAAPIVTPSSPIVSAPNRTDGNVDVIVEAEPATTRISLADQPDPKFVSPARLKARMGEQLSFVFEADGYETVRRTYTVATDPARLKVELHALPVDIIISVYPRDAVVTVDGVRAKPGMQVIPGRMVEVRAEHPFARTQISQGVPRAGERYVVELRLPEVDAPKPAHVPKGRVIITSKPPGAEVFIDNVKQAGVTPYEDNVLAGSHRITVRTSTGEQSFTVDIADGSVTKRNVVLE
jgi:serine/threonine protein kinase